MRFVLAYFVFKHLAFLLHSVLQYSTFTVKILEKNPPFLMVRYDVMLESVGHDASTSLLFLNGVMKAVHWVYVTA